MGIKRVLRWATCLLALCVVGCMSAAPRPTEAMRIQVVDADVALFWQVYDAVGAMDDRQQQLDYLQTHYLDAGTPGLTAFAEAKGYTAADYVDAIRAYPAYWDSVRPRTALAKDVLDRVEAHLPRFPEVYPRLRPATVYFEVGALRSAGTTREDKVLIGVEMATGDEGVDTRQMPAGLQRFFDGYFASRPLDNLDLLVVHELVHTQQRGERGSLLAQALYEGVADFVARQVTGRLPDLDYVRYGPAHDKEVKAAFVRDMHTNDYSGWLYNSIDNPFGTRDLGYYIGYAICAAYYAGAEDKQAAIAGMIELDYADAVAVERFVAASGYLDEGDAATPPARP
ncbi:hypothetical protein [Pseudoxanthomonas putridarboris]|uniref:DUF2268 domain-containing protein n=1 Tax=Pseudoxanthomonas putridarboris TaxID=752605 RepID=A0ABU9J127_9GAMM